MESVATDHKKKGDFDPWRREDKGGDEKQRDDRNENSRTVGQDSGSGGRDRILPPHAQHGEEDQ